MKNAAVIYVKLNYAQIGMNSCFGTTHINSLVHETEQRKDYATNVAGCKAMPLSLAFGNWLQERICRACSLPVSSFCNKGGVNLEEKSIWNKEVRKQIAEANHW